MDIEMTGFDLVIEEGNLGRFELPPPLALADACNDASASSNAVGDDGVRAEGSQGPVGPSELDASTAISSQALTAPASSSLTASADQAALISPRTLELDQVGGRLSRHGSKQATIAERNRRASSPARQSSDPNLRRRAWAHESKGKPKRAVLSPVLWSENELSAFFGCIGINFKTCRSIQRCNLPVHQFAQMPNTELRSRFGVTSAVEHLVIRKALKRFLELDRWENAVRGRRMADWQDDATLREYMIPLKELRIDIEISQGGFGTVYVGTLAPQCSRGRLKADSDYKVAVKEMKGDRHVQLHELLKEGRVMASLKHKNICKFIGISADVQSRGGRQFIVSELMDCSLFDLIHVPQRLTWNGEITIPLALSLSEGICAGIIYLHERRLVHADLKSSNILIDYRSSSRPIPKICDFGHVAMRCHPAPHHRFGTPHWAAPEALRQEALGPAADIFSCGIMLWEMLALSPPHRHLSSFAQVIAVVGWDGGKPDMELLPWVPEELSAILTVSLTFHPEGRPSARELRLMMRRLRKSARFEAYSSLCVFLGGSAETTRCSPDDDSRGMPPQMIVPPLAVVRGPGRGATSETTCCQCTLQ